MRLTEADYKKITRHRNKATNPERKGAPASSATEGTLETVINSIRRAKPQGEIIPCEKVAIQWDGMRLLSLNSMLRIDHRMLHAYRHACHDVVRVAVLDLARKNYGLLFNSPVELQIRRTGKKLLDTDGLYASFKFIIDGFRLAGVIKDDDPLHIVRMTHLQQKGPPSIGVTISRSEN